MPITLPHTVIEPTIDFTILTTSTQTFLAARPLPQGTACVIYRCSDASKPRSGSRSSCSYPWDWHAPCDLDKQATCQGETWVYNGKGFWPRDLPNTMLAAAPARLC